MAKPPQLTLLQKLQNAAQARKLDKFSSGSYNWYRNKVRAIGGDTARDEIMSYAKRKNPMKSNPSPGKMFTFVYDAKHKDKLPYWDAFPLIILLDIKGDHFYGVNMHYASPKMRAILFDKLLSITNNKRYDDSTKINLSYNLIKAAGKFGPFKPLFKKYLFSHVQSRITYIEPEDWEMALFLPTADFRKASNSKVWSETMLKGK